MRASIVLAFCSWGVSSIGGNRTCVEIESRVASIHRASGPADMLPRESRASSFWSLVSSPSLASKPEARSNCKMNGYSALFV